jgi:hypothetical protein
MLGWAMLGQVSVDPPKGYRFPNESDYSLDWQESRATIPTPFHVRADFNGDTITDDAWILLASQGRGWGVFVFLGSSQGPARVIELDVDDGKNAAQSFGLAVAKSGQHQTACGKGFGCEPGEPKILNLQLPGISFYQFESSSSIFWWNRSASKFERVWISD